MTNEICKLCKNLLGSKPPVKILWCGHSYCGECIEEYHYRRHNMKMVVCPVCSAETFAPEHRVEWLPINYDYPTEGDDENKENDDENMMVSSNENEISSAPMKENEIGRKQELSTIVEEDLSTQATMACGNFLKSTRITCSKESELFTSVPMANMSNSEEQVIDSEVYTIPLASLNVEDIADF